MWLFAFGSFLGRLSSGDLSSVSFHQINFEQSLWKNHIHTTRQQGWIRLTWKKNNKTNFSNKWEGIIIIKYIFHKYEYNTKNMYVFYFLYITIFFNRRLHKIYIHLFKKNFLDAIYWVTLFFYKHKNTDLKCTFNKNKHTDY